VNDCPHSAQCRVIGFIVRLCAADRHCNAILAAASGDRAVPTRRSRIVGHRSSRFVTRTATAPSTA
jgi:hypothetical protein